MIFKRCIPPTAAPVGLLNLIHGFIGLFYDGNRIHDFEREIKEYFQTRYVFLVSSGKAALTIILNGLASIDSRAEVVIPAYTCYSVPASIIRAGLKIKLCDINPDTLDYDYDKLDQVITKDTLCVVSSNLFGMPSDLKKLIALKNKYNIFLIEDVAQAMGCRYEGNKLGTTGDAAFFSLGRGKNVTCGSGGIIITSSKMIADAINPYYLGLPVEPRRHEVMDLVKTVVMALFLNPWLYCLPSSLPFLELGKTFFYTDFKIYKLSRVKMWLMKGWVSRLTIANSIREKHGREITGVDSGVSFLRIPYLCKTKESAEIVRNESIINKLGIVGMYPSAICDIPEISELFDKDNYKAAISIAERLITVPSHQLLNSKDINTLKNYLDKDCLCFIKPDKSSFKM